MHAEFTMQLREAARWAPTLNGALDDYPIFDEGYRLHLNTRIREHFWFREIGQETLDLFCFFLRRTMWEQMPRFNQLYESTRVKYDPLTQFDMHTVMRGESVGTDERTGRNTSTAQVQQGSRVIGSDFPQTMLAGNADYASNGTDSTATNTTTADADDTSSSTTKGDSTNTGATRGRSVSGAQLVLELRAAIINVDVEVLQVLEPLFMGLVHADTFDVPDWQGTPLGMIQATRFPFYYSPNTL